MTRQDTLRQREDKLFKSYQDKVNRNDLPGALKDIEKLLKITNIKAFVASLKVDSLIQMDRQSDALLAAEDGLRYPNPTSQLYKQHAQLLLSNAHEEDDLTRALSSIDTAMSLYNSDSVVEDITDRVQDVDNFKFWIEDKTRTRSEMVSLRSDIKSLLNSVQVYESVRKIEMDLKSEKIRILELMALFTTVIALVFTNVQFLAQRRTLMEIVAADVSAMIVVTWLVYLVSRITAGKSILPEISGEKAGKLLGLLILICVALLIVSGTIFAIVSVYGWLKGYKF